MKKTLIASLLFLNALLLLNSCGERKYVPDVSKVKVDLKFHRFDQEWFAIDSTKGVEGLEKLKAKYPIFGEFFSNYVLVMPQLPDTIPAERHLKLHLDWQARALYAECLKVHGDLEPIKKDLTEAFRFYKFYFPKKEIPEIYPYVAYYSYGTPILPGAVGIGLDFFLGEKHLGYGANENLKHAYVRRTLTPSQVSREVMYGMADDIVGAPTGPSMLDAMICNGKKLYLLDAFLPHAPDSVKLGWTQFQIDFCANGEANFYKLLIDEELLYSTRNQQFRKFIEQGPFNATSPTDNPGNSGSWLGWQMVKQYMKKTPNATMEGLLRAQPAQILQKYRP